jgi:hypothetical protein
MVDRGELEAKERLWTFFKNVGETELQLHDKTFLMQIINWVPVDETGRQKGLPLIEQVRWINLAQKIDEVEVKDGKDEFQEGKVELTNKDIELIWERINLKESKVGALTVPFIEFLLHFQEVTNRWFEELEPDAEEEEEEEEKKEPAKKKA